MSEEWGEITVYDPSMAVQVADMFNDFDELWPGGFGGGIPYDEQRVRDWLDDSSAIADMIALDANGEPVGFCGLCPHWRDEHAAYVNALGVVPRVKGKKYGKRLLLEAIETARAKGLQRVDLHTWSGNLDAVPLYKKVGMFWMPETSVYMQNYIPAPSQMSLSREWFAKHPDWYGCFQRELEQAPDKHVVDGMELYTYLFQVGDDRLVGEIDRYGWGICGIERVLDGEAISIKTRLRAHDILIGLPNEMTITMDNKTGRDLNVALTVEPFKGLQWKEPFPLSLPVQDGGTVSLSRAFVVDKTANAEYDSHKAAETIKSRIIFDGQVVDLITGGKLQPAVRVTRRLCYQVAPLGSTADVCLDLVNHAQEALHGKVDVFAEGVAGSQRRFDFALEPEELSGIVIPVPVPADALNPVRVVHATPSIEAGGTSFAMPTHHVSVVADVPGLSAVIEASDGKSLNLLTDVLDVHVELEGGQVHLQRRTLPGMRRRARFEAGPPFGISLDDTLKYEYETIQDGRSCTLVLRANSLQFPNLQICKCVRVVPGMREIEHWVTLTNLQASSAHTVGGRLNTGGGRGISLDPFREMSRTFTPLDGQVIECDAMLSFMNDNMVPQETEHWPETWTAAQTLSHGDYAAWFWRPEQITKVKVEQGFLTSLECEVRALAPGETYELFHVWYGFSFSSLPDVRNRWSQLVGRKAIPRNERFSVPTTPPIEARFAGENIVVRGNTIQKAVEMRFITPYPLPGELSLNLPDGWQGAFLTPEGSRPTIAMPEPVPGTPATLDIELAVPAETAAACEAVQLHFSGEFEIDLDLPLLLASDGEVSVERQTLQDQVMLAVCNDALRFAVIDGLSGSLIRLQDAQGRTFLYDNFPEVMPWFFFENHVGGLQPLVAGMPLEVLFDELEAVHADVVEEGRWKGVEVSWLVCKEEHLRGQKYGLAYLTLPGSSVLRVRLTHHNPTPRRIEWFGAVLANIALQGSAEGTVVHAPGGRATWIRYPTPKPFVSPANLSQPWVTVLKGEQSISLFSPRGHHGAVQVLEFPQFVMGILYSGLETDPEGHTELEFGLALNQPQSKVKQLIDALKHVD